MRLWTLALLVAALGVAQVGRAQPAPEIRVTKTADQCVVCVGEEITYTVTVENGTGVALRVRKIEDTLPGITVTPALPQNLPVGGTLSFTYTYTPTAAGTLENSVTVTARDPVAEVRYIGTATARVTVREEGTCPDITVTKTADTAVTKVGDTVRYTITITNNAEDHVNITRVTDSLVRPLPPSVLTALLGELSSYEEISATYCYTVKACDDVAPYVLTNTVKVFGALVEDGDGGMMLAPPAGDPLIGCATAEVDIVHPSLQVFKRASVTSADPGQPIKWFIKIVNAGDVALTRIKVCDPLLGGELTAFCRTLAPGAEETLCFDFCIPRNACGDVTNVVLATANPDDLPNVLTATATASVQVKAPALCPSICIEKTTDKECARPGETITYTFRVKNGPVALTNVQLTDPFFGSGPMPGFPTSLAPGQIVCRTICFTVPSCPPSSVLTNTATVRGCAGSMVVADSATATVYIVRANLTITAAPCATARPGKPIKILVTVKNTGTGTANDIWVTSNVPGGTWSGSCPRSLAPGCTATGYYTLCVPGNAPCSLPIGFKVTYTSENLPCCLEKTTSITIPVQR